jgi:hypothetical protein
MMKRLLPLALIGVLFLPAVARGQDYQMFEAQYLKVISGHEAEFATAIAAHNQSFHSEGAYAAAVDFIVTGPHSGQYAWVMGPATFTALDGRPTGDPHDADWNKVLAHAESHTYEYWRQNDRLSIPLTDAEGAAPILRIRFFEVANNALFVKTQEQAKAVYEQRGVTGRVFYRRRFTQPDGRDWALVTTMESWSELDEPGGGGIRADFIALHGEAAWETFVEERAQATVGVENEFRQRLVELSGGGNQ